jgi:hypothetical protein
MSSLRIPSLTPSQVNRKNIPSCLHRTTVGPKPYNARAAVVDIPSTAYAVIAAVHLDVLGESV